MTSVLLAELQHRLPSDAGGVESHRATRTSWGGSQQG